MDKKNFWIIISDKILSDKNLTDKQKLLFFNLQMLLNPNLKIKQECNYKILADRLGVSYRRIITLLQSLMIVINKDTEVLKIEKKPGKENTFIFNYTIQITQDYTYSGNINNKTDEMHTVLYKSLTDRGVNIPAADYLLKNYTYDTIHESLEIYDHYKKRKSSINPGYLITIIKNSKTNPGETKQRVLELKNIIGSDSAKNVCRKIVIDNIKEVEKIKQEFKISKLQKNEFTNGYNSKDTQYYSKFYNSLDPGLIFKVNEVACNLLDKSGWTSLMNDTKILKECEFPILFILFHNDYKTVISKKFKIAI